VEHFFSEDERKAIVAAIQKAEELTSGEIRVHIQPETERVLDDAAETFATLGIHKTKLRNGVLFFLATESKKFAILGDAGINTRVPEGFWNEISSCMSNLFKQGQFAKGLEEGILMAGKALQIHFPYDKTTDKNELSDDISYKA
jgi:uncharacterized membrane protein